MAPVSSATCSSPMPSRADRTSPTRLRTFSRPGHSLATSASLSWERSRTSSHTRSVSGRARISAT
jgi:hypothetical protein